MTEKEPQSWIRPEFLWSTAEESFACVAVMSDDLVRLIEDDGITVPILLKTVAEVTDRLAGGSLYGACCKRVAVETYRDQDLSFLYPDGHARNVTFVLHDLLRLPGDKVLVVLGSDQVPSYGQKHPEHKELAVRRMQRHRDDVAEHKRRLSETDGRFRAELAERGLSESEIDRLLLTGKILNLTPQQPASPQLADLDLQLDEVAFVPDVPKNKSAARRALVDAVRTSKRGPSRSGSYDCTRIQSDAGEEVGIIRWTPRSSHPPALELKASLQRVFPSAFVRPRRPDQTPPGPLAGGPDVEISAGAWSGMDSLQIVDDLPARLEESIGAMGGRSQATEEARRGFERNGFDALAWYQAFHRYADPVWGIYFSARKLDALAWSLAEELQKANEPQAFRLASVLAVELTRAHEMFHAHVEFAATWLELSSHRKRYLPYFDQIYDRRRNSPDQIEEALANWSAHTWLLANLERFRAEGLVQNPPALMRIVEVWLDSSPAGYSEWRIGDQHTYWQQLTTEMALVGQRRQRSQTMALPLEGLLRAEAPIDLRREDIPNFLYGRGALADMLFSAPARREVVRVLSSCGYQPLPGRGKGSHEVYQGPDNRHFSLPARDPLSVGVFHSLLKHFDWTKEQYLREIRV